MSMVRLLCKPLIVLLKTIRDVIGPVIENGVTISLPRGINFSIKMDFLVILIVSLETAIIIYRQDPKLGRVDRGLTFIIHRVLQWILLGEYGLRLVSRGVWFSDTAVFKTVWGWIDTIAIASMVADTQTPFLNLMFLRLLYAFKFLATNQSDSSSQNLFAKFLTSLQVLSSTIMNSINGIIYVVFLVALSVCFISGFTLRSVGLNAVYERRCALSDGAGEVRDVVPFQHCPYPTTNTNGFCPSKAQCIPGPVASGNNYCDWGAASTKVLQAFFLDGFLPSVSEMETAVHGSVIVVWVASIVFGSFMLLNLLVSVIVSEYSSANFMNKKAKEEAAANAEDPPVKAVVIKDVKNEEGEEEEEDTGYKVTDYNDDFDLASFAFSQIGFAGCGAGLATIETFGKAANAIQVSCWSVLACMLPKCCDPASIEKDVTKKWYYKGYDQLCKFSAKLVFWKFTLVPNNLILKLCDDDVKFLDSVLTILFPRSVFPKEKIPAAISRFLPVTFSSLWINWETFGAPEALPLCMQPKCQESDRQQHIVDWLNELELPVYSGWDVVTACLSFLHLFSLAFSYNGMCHFIYQVNPGSSISLSSIDVEQCSRAMILRAVNIAWLIILVFRLMFLWCAHRSVICFIRRRWNYFELVVTGIVCVGLFVSDVIGLSQTSPSFWFFKLMRCGSIFWILKVVPVPKLFVRAFGDPFGMISAMLIVIFLNFVMAIFGRELFKRILFLKTPNFVSLSGAFSVMMIILLGEQFDSYSAFALGQRFGIAGYLLFVLWHFLMALTFLKLFVAMIVDNMSLSPEQRLAGQKLLLENDLRKVKEGEAHGKWGAFDLADKKAGGDTGHLDEIRRKSITSAFSRGQINSSVYSPPDENAKGVLFDQDVIPLSIMANFSFIHQRDLLQGEGSNIPIETLMKKAKDDVEASNLRIRSIKVAPKSELVTITRNSLSSIKPAPLDGASSSDDSAPPEGIKKRLLWLREKLREFTQSSLFDGILALVVILSTILCVINTPASHPIPESVIEQLDVAFLVIFALEAITKICIQGNHPFDLESGGYFCQGLNWFDFIILIFQILDIIESTSGALFNFVESANWISGVRGLRALRLIPRLTRLQIGSFENPFKFAVNTIKMSASEILLVMFVLLSFSSLFSLFGMSLFSGLFYQCKGDDKSDSQRCFGPVLYENMALPGRQYLIPLTWSRTSGLHFDDFGGGILTMVKLLNKGGISGLISLSTSVTQWGSAPLMNSAVVNAVFVIIFQLFFGVLMSQMIVGTLTNNLSLSTGAGLLTETQQRWKATRMMIEDELQAPKKTEVIDPSEKDPGCDRVIAMMTGAVLSSAFDNMCAAVVLFNYALIALRACSNDYSLILSSYVLLYVCIYFYLAEFVIRATCVFISHMPNDENDRKTWLWCSSSLFLFLRAMIFEFWIDIIGIAAVFADVIVEQLYGVHIGCSTLCLIRLHRILSRNRTIMNYWATLKKSFPVTLSLCFIIFIWIFLFAVLGSKLFAEVKSGRIVDYVNNFSTFPKACRFLFFLGLGESWTEVIDELAVSWPACTIGPRTDCGPSGTLPFILIFILGMNFFLLPMFSSVVITFYSEAMTLSKSSVSFQDCEKFRDYFIKYSVGQMTLPVTQLRGLMEKLVSVRCKISVVPGKEGKDHNGRPWKNNRGYSKFEEHVMALSKREGEELVIHWKQLARLAVSHRFTPEAVTVVDIKLKELALDAIKGIGQRPAGDVDTPLTLDAQFRENVMEKSKGGAADLSAVIGNRMDPSVFELTLIGIEQSLPQSAGGPVNQKVKIRNPDEYSNFKVKKEPIKDGQTAAQRETLDLKYDIEKKTTLMKDMVADNLLTNQEAFVVLQHWELHTRRRKYEAAKNASQSPVPEAKNIDLNDFTNFGVHMWKPSQNLEKLQSGGQSDGWNIAKSRHKFDALELVDKLWTHFDNNTDPKEDKIINPSYVKPKPADDDEAAAPLSKKERDQKKALEKQLKFDNFINLASQCRKAAAICAYSYNIAQILEDMVFDELLSDAVHQDAYQALITDKSFDYRDVPKASQHAAQSFIASLSIARKLLAEYKREANWASYHKLSCGLIDLAKSYAHLKSSLDHSTGTRGQVPASIMIDEATLKLAHQTLPPPPPALQLPVVSQPYSLSPIELPAQGQHVAWSPPHNAAPIVSHASAASLFGTLQMPPSDEWKTKNVEVISSNGSTTIELSRWGFCLWCRAPVDNSWPICPAAGCGRPIVQQTSQPLSAPSSTNVTLPSLGTEKSWLSSLPSLKLPPLPFFGSEPPPEEGVTLSV